MPRAPIGFTPASCVSGSFRPGVSKSVAQRLAVAAGLVRPPAPLDGFAGALGDGLPDDVRRALACAAILGAEGETADRDLDVGESGTLARLLTAAAALAREPERETRVRPAGTLLERSSPALFRALERCGVQTVFEGRVDGWPALVRAVDPPDELELRDPGSSQELSGLLLALAASGRAHRVAVRGALPSRPYVRMTVRILERLGARVEESRSASGDETFSVRGPLHLPAEGLPLEPDASSAAVALAAACLSGGTVEVDGLGSSSVQGDVRIVEHLAAFGCEAHAEGARLVASGAPTRAVDLDLSGEPDLAPVLAAVAAAAAPVAGRSRLRGLGTLPGKESDRLAGCARALDALGYSVEVTADALSVAGEPRPGASLLLDPRGDHRMAFHGALLGLAHPDVRVSDGDCVAKSWPGFWEDLFGLGAVLH